MEQQIQIALEDTGARPAEAELAGARSLVWLTALSHAANHGAMLLFPAILLLIQQEFSLGYFRLGVYANVALLLYGLGALPAGILADRLGPTRMLAIWLVGGACSCLWIGLARTPLFLGIGLAALGAFASLHHPAAGAVLAAFRDLPGGQVGRAFGFNGAAGNVGIALTPLAAGLVGAAWGWRVPFLVFAPVALALAAVLFMLPPSTLAGRLARGDRRPFRWRALGGPLGILLGMEVFLGFVFQGVMTFLPTYMAGRAGLPGLPLGGVVRGGAAATLALLAGSAGHYLGGRMMSGARRERTMLWTILAIAPLLVLMSRTWGAALVLAAVAFSVVYFGAGTMSNTLIAVHSGAMGGTIFGLVFLLSFGVGSFASSAMGYVAERAGLGLVFAWLGGVALGASALAFVLNRLVGRDRMARI